MHPAVTVDITVFTVRNDELNVLLIKRAEAPFQGEWAIPGTFAYSNWTEDDLSGKARQAFTHGWLGLTSFGRASVVAVTTITDTIASGIWEVSIANSNNFVYFVTSTGTVTEGGARWAGAQRTIGIVTKMIFANIDPPAALTTRGKTVVKGNALINGTNTTPPSWGPYCTAFPTDGFQSPVLVCWAWWDVSGVLSDP